MATSRNAGCFLRLACPVNYKIMLRADFHKGRVVTRCSLGSPLLMSFIFITDFLPYNARKAKHAGGIPQTASGDWKRS